MSVILAVDPGDVRIGLAVSDPTGLIARPLQVFGHTARAEDAAHIVQVAEEHQAVAIVIGLALDAEGNVGYQARKGLRLAAAIEAVTTITVLTYDESGTTLAALKGRKKDSALDARAAAHLLQEYLNARET
ncbi:MAG: Holliday junction resolvase RuvX [Anaerolineales bacterium]|nr:Holliday junction resolvase RuvX [Anaerolineales bacterium]